MLRILFHAFIHSSSQNKSIKTHTSPVSELSFLQENWQHNKNLKIRKTDQPLNSVCNVFSSIDLLFFTKGILLGVTKWRATLRSLHNDNEYGYHKTRILHVPLLVNFCNLLNMREGVQYSNFNIYLQHITRSVLNHMNNFIWMDLFHLPIRTRGKTSVFL